MWLFTLLISSGVKMPCSTNSFNKRLSKQFPTFCPMLCLIFEKSDAKQYDIAIMLTKTNEKTNL